MGPVQQAMADSGLTPAQISKVLMVGGSSRIPAVQAAVKRFTGKEPLKVSIRTNALPLAQPYKAELWAAK